MTDPSGTNQDQSKEISILKQRIRELEKSESKCKRLEEALQKSEGKFLELLEHINDIFYELDTRGIMQYCSPSVENLFGYSQAEIIGRSINDFLDAEDRISDIEERVQRVMAGKAAPHEYRIRRKTGEIRWIRVYSNPVRKGDQLVGIRGIMSDITERKLQEDEREKTAHLITLVNTPGDFRKRMSDLTASLQGWSGCEAVGIRLGSGDDYPYFETHGFPPAFVQEENQLCMYGPDGKILRDGNGSPVLECMCGNILCGRFDTSKPFFTAHGSFWSNNTTALLASTTESDRQARTRNRCNGEGYESVALIPLRTSDQVFGLLQFNDHRPDRFTPGLIAHFERMADILAIALSQRQAEEKLRESEEIMRFIIKHDPNAIAVYDLGLHYVAVSDRYLQDYNVKEADIIGEHHYDVFPEMPQTWKDVHQRCLSGMIERNDDDYFERPDGSITYNRWECRPWYRANGKIGGMITYTEVTTERKRAELEKRSMEERLQRSEKMEALGKMAGGVAHDLNNVLGIMSGYSELLLEEIPEGHRSRVYVEKIFQSTEKGAAIIQDLLTLARRGVMTSDVINLNTIVSDFLQTPVFEKMKDYNPRVTFKTECDRNLLNIKGSPVHLEKTVMNLVLNAAEAISGKGEVTIRTESRYLDKPVRGYDTIKEGDYSVLTVSDTGVGIPAENIGKIFEPFYTKKTMGRSGTGLGLAIVWGTAKDHNGYIDVQTEVGQGTTFTLYFPVTREEQTAPQQQKVQIERYMGKGELVLVVDDVPEQREVAARLLTRLGYKVHVVSSGEEAVEYLKVNKADLLVLDMIMTPGIDGLETYQRIQEINPRQKAILVSGFSETERVKEAQKLGAGPYVKKPYMMEKIGLALKKELDRK